MKPMTVSSYIKSKGGKNLKGLAEFTGFHAQTLDRWFKDEYDRATKLDPQLDRYIAHLDRMADKQGA